MAGDLKTFFNNPVISSADPGGDGIPSRGTDPLIDTGGTDGLKAIWEGDITGDPGTQETANSVSGLPLRPSRMSPSPAEPPMPPSLKDRSPGTIDER